MAVDWSGAAEPLRNLWLAEAEPGRIVDVRQFVTRAAVIEHLVAASEREAGVIAGLDFAFSLPAFFLEELAVSRPRELWERMRTEAERWLAPAAPFWGKGGARRPHISEELRQTEKEVAALTGKRPTSTFKLVGADQVGTGSLRGMPWLAALEDAGFAIWPFSTGPSLVVEIYPGVLTQLDRKTNPARIAAAVRDDDRIPVAWKAHAACSPDAFDAVASALAMADHVGELGDLTVADPVSPYALEGRIWLPASGTGRLRQR